MLNYPTSVHGVLRPISALLLLAGAILTSPPLHAELPTIVDLTAGDQDVTVYGSPNGHMLVREPDGSGDINGDGVDDLFFATIANPPPYAPTTYLPVVFVFFGGTSLPGALDTLGLVGAAPDLTIWGTYEGTNLAPIRGTLVADLNDDGIGDLVIGTEGAFGGTRNRSGEVYIIYGSQTLPAVVNLSLGEADVSIFGANPEDNLCLYANMTSGDVNNDGITDLLLGAKYGDGPAEGRTNCGEVYIIYGSASLPPMINLIDGDEDVTIYGASAIDLLAQYQDICCDDITGDGIDDIVLCSVEADGPLEDRSRGGEVYVIRGSSGLPSTIDLGSSDEDLTIYGATRNDYLTRPGCITLADINGDSIRDIVVGAARADGPLDSRTDAGEIYIIYGAATFPDTIDLAAGGQDVIIYGATANDFLSGFQIGDGFSMAPSPCDVNADGIDDLIIGSGNADGPGETRSAAGEAYIIYGSASLPSIIDLNSGDQDVIIYGAERLSALTYENAIRFGDPNGDGLTDFLLGAPLENGGVGTAYLFYGGRPLPPIIDLNTDSAHVKIVGNEPDEGFSPYNHLPVADVNGDGIDDIVLIAYQADGPDGTRTNAGEAYIIYGSPDVPPAVQSITVSSSTPGSVTFTVVFSEWVTGVDISDFSVVASGFSSTTITDIAGTGSTYLVTVTYVGEYGTIRLDLIDDDSIEDPTRNPLAGVGLLNGDFRGGEVWQNSPGLPALSGLAQVLLFVLIVCAGARVPLCRRRYRQQPNK